MNLWRLIIVVGFPSLTIYGWLNAVRLLNWINPFMGLGFGIGYPILYTILYRGMIKELGWKRYFREIFERKPE